MNSPSLLPPFRSAGQALPLDRNRFATPSSGRRFARHVLPLLVGSTLASSALGLQYGPKKTLVPEADRVTSTFAADLDGDGDMDLLSTSAGDAMLAWFENEDGQGSFGPRRFIAQVKHALAACATDVDGDGDLDVIAAGRDQVVWSENEDGAGLFGPSQLVTTSIQASSDPGNPLLSLSTADLDGDGDPDVLVTSPGKSFVAWYENADGSGGAWSQRLLSVSVPLPSLVCAVDLDGDGDQDVLWSSLASPPLLAWQENTDGVGNFGPRLQISTATEWVWSAAAIDLDGDGDQDLLASTSWPDSRLIWFENQDGAGQFGPQQLISAEPLENSVVAAADFDGDGDQDVVWGSGADDAHYYGPQQIAWHENLDGLGAFGPQQIVTTSVFGVGSIVAADLDGDGDQDLASASMYDDMLAWYENEDGQGDFGPLKSLVAAAASPSSLCTADLDGDGDLDALSASYGDDKIAWYPYEQDLSDFGPQRVITTEADGARQVDTADLDGDGDQDVLSLSTLDQHLAWYENTDSLGTFGPARTISTTSGGESLATEDLDGDGDQDVVGYSTAIQQIVWFENRNGLGSFGAERPVSSGDGTATAFRVEDFDGDGDRDVVAEGAWYENLDAAGTFGAPVLLSFPGDYPDAYTADLDGDGDHDALVYSYTGGWGSSSVAWCENLDGKGTFGPPEVLLSGVSDLDQVWALDMDSDGDQDVLVMTSYTNGLGSTFWSISWFDNVAGPSTLEGGGGLSGQGNPYHIQFADFEGDGDPDVLYAWAGYWDPSRKIWWHENLLAPLMGNTNGISLSSSYGGTQYLSLTAGSEHGLQPFLILGSVSGSSPGLSWEGHVLPLNFDAYLLLTLSTPNGALISNSFGVLSAGGRASAQFSIPAGLSPSLAGVTFHHAYVVIDLDTVPGSPQLSFVSNAVSVQLLP